MVRFSLLYRSLPTLFSVIVFAGLLLGCNSHTGDPADSTAPVFSPVIGLNGPCFDIEGRVRGDFIPGSNVTLHPVSSLNMGSILYEIRNIRPIAGSTVDENGEFGFVCVSLGRYAFVTPMSSYRGQVGAPLPHEFETPDYSLKVALQGGDSRYIVGAFSIQGSTGRADKAGRVR